MLHDVRSAIRSLVRRPGFTSVAGLTLALGGGATTAIFSVVSAVLLEPLPYHDAHELVTLWQTDRRGGNDRQVVSFPDFRDWRHLRVAARLAPGVGVERARNEIEAVAAVLVPAVRAAGIAPAVALREE